MPRPPAGAARPRPKATFIEAARRRQILDIALREITAKGYGNTTLQEIAKQADISKGVIYYHFNDREELLRSIWSELIGELFEYRRRRVEAAAGAREKLNAYVAANFAFLAEHFNKIAALFRMGIDLGAGSRRPNPWSEEINARCFAYLAGILRAGQESGEFGDFSPEAAAAVIQGAIDGLALQSLSSPPPYDLAACRHLLIEVIARFTAPGPPAPGRLRPRRARRAP
jgi:AcrR family transcriptional regulator